MLMKDYTSMIKVCLRALEIFTEVFGKFHIELANIHNMLGIAYAMVGQYLQAIKHYDNALALRYELDMSNNYGTAELLINKANMLKMVEDYESALEFELKALEIGRKFFEEKSPRLLVIFQSLATTYRHLDNKPLAFVNYRKVLKIYQRIFNLQDHSLIVQTLHAMGDVLSDKSEALNFHLQALNMINRLKPKPHIKIAQSLYTVGKSMLINDQSFNSLVTFEELV